MTASDSPQPPFRASSSIFLLAQITDQVIVEGEVGVSAVQSQRRDAGVLQLLADVQELGPGGGLGLDAGLGEGILVIEDAADLGLLGDGVQEAGPTR